MSDDRRRGRTITALAAVTALAVLAVGCTGDDGIELVVDEGTDEDIALEMAMDNAYGTSSRMLDGAAFGALSLEVEYFEPLRKGEWVAPGHCTFSTRVSVNAELRSAGFDGPRRDDDRDAGEGVLVGTVSTLVAGVPSEPTPGEQPTATTVVEAPVTTLEVEVIEPVTTAPDPVGAGDGSDAGDGSTETTAPSGAAIDEPRPVAPPEDLIHDEPVHDDPNLDGRDSLHPGVFQPRPATAAVAVVFGHRQVVELSSDHPAVLDGHGLQAQPLDGWNLLSVALDAEADLGADVPATLRRIHEDGTETTEQLRIPVGGNELTLLNDDWRFDLSRVDASCSVPDGSVDNVPTAPDTDILGSPVGDAPDLPEPGTPPPDPAAAADEALRSLRALYDLKDIYAASKRDHLENPDDWDVMRRQLLANDVVAPYMSNLDPEFRSSVFVSPTEVHVLYRVGPSYQWEIGRVLLIDGRWRVAAGTVCRDLSAAGYRCPGTINDPPPGPLG